MLSLGVFNGHIIHIKAEGTDELQAIEGISALVKDNVSLYKLIEKILFYFSLLSNQELLW